jgi:hypothetical protein
MKPVFSPPLPAPRRATRLVRTFAGGILALLLLSPDAARAYPPAPYHTFFGMVRDEMGQPIDVSNGEVILETLTGVKVRTTLVPHLGPGFNYRLRVPMDSGLTSDAYRPTALRPTVAFRIQVKIGQALFLPIELRGSYTHLGDPAASTRLDLTIGEDLDGDGLPDAWERALIEMLGGGLTSWDIHPHDDADGDGLSNLEEYLAGTYAWDPEDGLRLDVAGVQDGQPLLDFLAIRGRRYTILASTDLVNWEPVAFLPANSPAGTLPAFFHTAASTRLQRMRVVAPPAGASPGDEPPSVRMQTFKLLAQ